MTEEKKDVKPEAPVEQKPPENQQPKKDEAKPDLTPQAAGNAPAQSTPAQAAAQEIPKEAPGKAAPLKKERPANCAGCNKSVKKKRWYYRAGKYYCTKRCWRTAQKKEEKPKEASAKK